MGSAHRRRRSTLAVVVTVTTIVGVRLAVAGAAQPLAGPTAIPAVATPSAAPPAVTGTAAQAPTSPTSPSSPAPAATAHRPATRSPSASPSPTPHPSDSAGPSDSASPSDSVSPAPSVTSTGPPACDPRALRLDALGAAGNAGAALVAGSPVRFTVTLTSTSTATRGCVVLPVVDLVITSGHDRIWTSADCPVAAVGGPGVTAVPALTGTARALLVPGGALLEPGASVSLDLVWPGVRSAGSCTAVPTPLVAGTYVAAVAVPGAGSTDEVFTLR